MYWEDGNLRISPSDLIVFLESEFASWMDRWLVDGDTAGPVFDTVRTGNGSAGLKPKPIPDEAARDSRRLAHFKPPRPEIRTPESQNKTQGNLG